MKVTTIEISREQALICLMALATKSEICKMEARKLRGVGRVAAEWQRRADVYAEMFNFIDGKVHP